MRIISGRRVAGIIAVGGAAALIAAGCGGGGDNGDSLSNAEYIEQADAICAAFERQLDAIDEPTSDAGFVPFLRAVLPIIRAQIDELRALNPPADIEGQVNEALDLLDEQAEISEEAINRVEDGGEDAEAVAADVGPRLQTVNDEAEQIADDIGLQECGSDEADTTTGTAPATTGDEPATAPTTEADPGTTEAAPTGEVALSQFTGDLAQASSALGGFGRALTRAVADPSDISSLAPDLQSNADRFREAIDAMGGYTVDNSAAETQRARLVAAGPEVADVLQQMVDAAEDNDIQALVGLTPDLTEAVREFSASP